MSGFRETIFTDLKRCVGHSCRYRAPDVSAVLFVGASRIGARIECQEKLVVELPIYTAAINIERKPTILGYFVLDFSMTFA